MGEKRKLKRRHLIYYLSVFDQNSGKFLGQLVDITTEGMMLTSEAPLKENLIYSLKMVLPEKIHGKMEISFKAKSLWCNPDINPNFYDIGFQFIDISLKDVKIIESLIYEFSFQN